MKHYRYAHRGLHDAAAGIPENSMAAFRRAIGHGFGSELDVHLLADGSLAVFHDSALERMTGRTGEIEYLSAARLAEYRLGGTEETIPRLCEVLELYDGTKLPLLVELKSHGGNAGALAARTTEELDRFRVPYVIESFDPRCLLWLRKNRPEIVRGQLAQDFLRPGAASGMGGAVDRLLAHMALNAATRPDFVAFNFDHRDAPALKRVRLLRSAEIFYWTIRSRADMETAEAEGAQVIFEGFVP